MNAVTYVLNTHLRPNIYRIRCRSVDFQFGFTILGNLSDERYSVAEVFIFLFAHFVHFIQSMAEMIETIFIQLSLHPVCMYVHTFSANLYLWSVAAGNADDSPHNLHRSHFPNPSNQL